ncbi:MAG TPA: phosphate ABC transporter permease PstA [Fimbriimonas sp.]|nr:phosphate ABC transporter permease PstA [Fimbriimonas sp.]
MSLYSRRRAVDRAFGWICGAATLVGLAALVSILVKIAWDGAPRLGPSFLTSALSHRPEETGVAPAVVGSIFVVLLTMAMAGPVGICSAVYMEELAPVRSRMTWLMRQATNNLAGVPSVVYGLIGLAVFVRWFGLGASVLSGALTLALVVLPMVVIVTQQALRSVPSSYREASLALGATQWQAIRTVVLPAASQGIWTGLLLAFSRAMGETAPLMVVGAAYYVTTPPRGFGDSYTVLPMQIFNWSSDARKGFHSAAAAATLVLVLILLGMNTIVLARRNRTAKAFRS